MVRVMMAELSPPTSRPSRTGLQDQFEEDLGEGDHAGHGARRAAVDAASRMLLAQVIAATVVGRVMRGEEPPDESFCQRRSSTSSWRER